MKNHCTCKRFWVFRALLIYGEGRVTREKRPQTLMWGPWISASAGQVQNGEAGIRQKTVEIPLCLDSNQKEDLWPASWVALWGSSLADISYQGLRYSCKKGQGSRGSDVPSWYPMVWELAEEECWQSAGVSLRAVRKECKWESMWMRSREMPTGINAHN